MKILAAIHDLMFSSKVNAAAQGKPIAWLPRGTPVAEHVAKEKPDVLLIDLAAPALNAVEAVRAIKSSPETSGSGIPQRGRSCTTPTEAASTRRGPTKRGWSSTASRPR